MHRFFFWFCFTILVSGCRSINDPTPSQATESSADLQKPETMLHIARAAHAGGDNGTALRFYQRLLKQNPHHTIALLELADLLIRASSFHEARLLLDRISEKDHPERLRLLGKIALGMDEPEKALDFFQKILSQNAHHAYALEGVAIAYDTLGQHTQAHEFYKRAMSLPHVSHTLRSNYGLSLALGGKVDEGIVLLKHVCQGGNPTPRDRQNLGIAYGLKGDLEKSGQWLSVDLDNDRVRQNLAYLRYILHKGEKADLKKIIAPPQDM